jgi:hypothetical protein
MVVAISNSFIRFALEAQFVEIAYVVIIRVENIETIEAHLPAISSIV